LCEPGVSVRWLFDKVRAHSWRSYEEGELWNEYAGGVIIAGLQRDTESRSQFLARRSRSIAEGVAVLEVGHVGNDLVDLFSGCETSDKAARSAANQT
jgi:hypothetical protein